jgi:hypothetical protein
VKKLTPQELLNGLESFDVVELDQRSLRMISSGQTLAGTTDLSFNDDREGVATNGNCGCAAGSTYSGTPTNGNCGCGS